MLDALWHHAVDALSLGDVMANLRAADIEQRCLDDGDSLWHFSDVGTFSGIDHDGIMGEDVVMVIPFVESCPVVATY